MPRSEGCGFFWAGNGRWTSEHILGTGFQVKLTELHLGLEGAEEVTSGDMGKSCDGIRTLDWLCSEHKKE